MKYCLTILLMLLTNVFLVFTKPVDVATAKFIGINFMNNYVDLKHNSISPKSTNLVYTSQSTGFITENIRQANYFYIFNIGDFGYIVVSADDIVYPILAYSLEGNFDTNMPPHVAKWFEGYKNQIRYVIANNFQATKNIESMWLSLRDNNTQIINDNTTAVNPLVTVKWGQDDYYNALCPMDYNYNERTVTGCVATAMAMIMKYWNYPAQGLGFHQYNHNKYGTLSANFGSTKYDWASMPYKATGQNNAVATLMYHCGVSVDMGYGVGKQGGSGAFIITDDSPNQNCSEFAFLNYFGYKNTLKGELREKYSDAQWISKLKAELDAKRPVLYGGIGNGGGHCFVNDGYDNNNFFHFNWGWDGYFDGYFNIDALNPQGTGTGGGTGGFNYGQQAIFGLEPASKQDGGQNPNIPILKLNNILSPVQSQINYGEAFTYYTNLVNSSSFTFSGDYCLVAFDKDYNFVDIIDIIQNEELPPNYTYNNNISFSTESNLSLIPGTYYLAVFYKHTGTNWKLVEDNNNYHNLAQLDVVNPQGLNINSPLTTNPQISSIKQGGSLSVNLNILNNSQYTFKGAYAVNLYKLNGDFAQNINIIEENDGLPGGYTYQSPYLNFSTNNITVEPGTYLLAVMYRVEGYNNWYLVGSQQYPNPIRITVEGKDLIPDKYESNNEIVTSYKINPSFTGDKVLISTTGSNCHVGNDYDFYKIDVPSGWTYTFKPRLQDNSSSNNGQSYSLDALFSYSLDGNDWSEAYDDVFDDEIKVSGGKSIYFFVSPYFTGNTGTYQLDLNITRTQGGSIVELDENSVVSIYPNPSNGILNMDISILNEEILDIKIYDLKGNNLLNISNNLEKINQIDLNSFNNGNYNIQIRTKNNIYIKNFIIKK